MTDGVARFACMAHSPVVRPVRQLAFAVVVGVGLGALTVAALGGLGERDDAEIANAVMAAGDLATWNSGPGEVCMRWGDRFQACDTISTNPPLGIGLTPDDPPPQPLSLPRDAPPPLRR